MTTRVYSVSEHVLTAVEFRGIRLGLAEIRRGNFVTLNQLSDELKSPLR